MDSLPDITMPEVSEVVEEQTDNNIKVEITDREASDNEDLMAELEKPKMSQEQIFQTPIIKKVNEPKPIKPKRVLSEEHKAKLALAREKALETRRANAAIKKETKDLEKKVKTNKLNKLREEADEPIKSEPVDIPVQKVVQPVGKNISQADLEAVALNAIVGHERIRKARKQKKKEAEEVTYQQNLLKQQLSNVMNNQPVKQQFSTNGVWDDFF
tara:strand:- start:166 stop:807 length:642 start_codon:yes stop_codon:yes gene_type:complete